MAEQYCGKLEKKLSKAGKEYFKGRVMGIPVVAFWGNKDPNSINLKLDVSLIKWIDEQDENQEKAPPVPDEVGTQEEDDLPF